MTGRPPVECIETSCREEEKIRWLEREGVDEHARPFISHSLSDPIPLRKKNREMKVVVAGIPNTTPDDIVEEAISPVLHRTLYTQKSREWHLNSTMENSPPQARSSTINASPASSASSSVSYTSDDYRTMSERGQTTATSLLKSSTSIVPSTIETLGGAAVQPSDFCLPPEEPEERFVDDLGMIFPGICDRPQCAHSQVHFVTGFRLCEPIEYTTALADHGVTYTDYCRLVTALREFLHKKGKRRKRRKGRGERVVIPSTEAGDDEPTVTTSASGMRNNYWDTTEQLKEYRKKAVALNTLLKEITWNLQARGVSVMICVQSFSLFAPSRVSEAHIQILHVSRDRILQAALEFAPKGKASQRTGQRLSFIDVFTFAGLETLERQEMSVAETTTRFRDNPVCFKAQNRDRSKPCALSPNSIPLRKRPILSGNIDRYGVDPYFRAWIRANVNDQTRCSTYAEFLIEKDDNPLVNKKLQYADITLNRGNVDALVRDERAWKEQFPSSVNRAKYDHNRRLECRNAVDHGSRLRVLRFGFQHPIYPPHTPEMDTLGLDKHAYQSIIANIDRMSSGMPINTRCPCEYMVDSLHKSRRRGTEEALMKVREFIRRLNASQRNMVWTIEKIPWVYDKGLGCNRTEWEISAWNAEDPLELLMQLERWGIIEKRMSPDEED